MNLPADRGELSTFAATSNAQVFALKGLRMPAPAIALHRIRAPMELALGVAGAHPRVVATRKPDESDV